MKMTLEIKMGNEAMLTPNHLVEALSTVQIQLLNHSNGNVIRDSNGNTVGEWSVK